jgi:hypothetical protein
MKDETADDIAKELRLIREELQKLTSAVRLPECGIGRSAELATRQKRFLAPV